MGLKIDQNLPAEAADLLQLAGHDATTVLRQGLRGAPDRQVLSICQEESRALVTLDIAGGRQVTEAAARSGQPSNTSLIFLASESSENGFGRKCIPSSSTPRWATTLVV